MFTQHTSCSQHHTLGETRRFFMPVPHGRTPRRVDLSQFKFRYTPPASEQSFLTSFQENLRWALHCLRDKIRSGPNELNRPEKPASRSS